MRTSKTKRIYLAVSTLTLGAFLGVFLGDSFPAQATRHRKSPAAATADCKTDSDCVAVPDDCCSCNEGGKQHAIPKSQKDAYEKARKKRCAGTMCTEVMSRDPSCSMRAFCGAGICELEAAPTAAP
jgi:hypothetical protein